MIDRLGNVAQRREAMFAEDLLLTRVDEMDAAAIAELAQIGKNLAGPFRPLRGADDRYGSGLQYARRRPQNVFALRHALSLPIPA